MLHLGPSQLKGPFDSSGFPVGCKSACVANLDGNPGIYLPFEPSYALHGFHLQETLVIVAPVATIPPQPAPLLVIPNFDILLLMSHVLLK